MDKEQNPYLSFNHFVFRSPYHSLNKLLLWLSEIDKSKGFLKNVLKDDDIQEAIFLASPVLHAEISKYLEGKLGSKEEEKFFFSILKYLSRMAARSTPFGLFAGCSTGTIIDRTAIKLPLKEEYTSRTRLDMDYLCALAQDLSKREEIKKQLLFYPNTSCYITGDKLRYVEYQYTRGIRRHSIVAVNNSGYLQELLEVARAGKTIEELIATLVNDEIDRNEAILFIDELIDSQLLVSELEPSVTGLELLDQLLLTLKKLSGIDEVIVKLDTLSELLQAIDLRPIGMRYSLYGEIKTLIKELETTYNEQNLFQTDMLKPSKDSTIEHKVVDQVLKAVTMMNKLTPSSNQETMLEKFATSFYQRYEEREVPLPNLLDIDIGLDLLQSGSVGDVSPLLNGIPFRPKRDEEATYSWDNIQSVFHRKIIEALGRKENEIIISDDDFSFAKADWGDLSHTITAMCKIFSYTSDNELKIYIQSSGGSSAANLLGRFCLVDKRINEHVQDIIEEEESLSDKLYAEIVHLPESRAGNILARPLLRKYEIPYLVKSGVEEEFQIPLTDLMVSYRNGRFILRSKKLNKEIVPRLTTAHNYTLNAMPIYQFLANMQFQGKRIGVGFNLSSIFNEFKYLPRISYKNIIFSLARWNFSPDELKPFATSTSSQSAESFITWKKEQSVPRFVILPDGDNELFVDMESMASIKMLYDVVKKRNFFTLQEFPFDMNNAILKNSSGSYANEFVFAFHKSKE